MSIAKLARSMASIVSITPPRRTEKLKYLSPQQIPNAGRDDRQAIWGDFCTVGNDMRNVIRNK